MRNGRDPWCDPVPSNGKLVSGGAAREVRLAALAVKSGDDLNDLKSANAAVARNNPDYGLCESSCYSGERFFSSGIGSRTLTFGSERHCDYLGEFNSQKR